MEKNKFYLTKEGLERFQKELAQLKKIKVSKMSDEAPGTLASNRIDSEYLVFQEDVGLLEARIEEIAEILMNHELIKKPVKSQQGMIQLGAMVCVEVDGRIDEFTIVGSLEANPSVGRISDESPVGKALLGKRLNDEVLISSPIKITYKIKRIKYMIS